MITPTLIKTVTYVIFFSYFSIMFLRKFKPEGNESSIQKVWYYLGGGIGMSSSLFYPWLKNWKPEFGIFLIIVLLGFLCMNQRLYMVYKNDFYNIKESDANYQKKRKNAKKMCQLMKMIRILGLIGLSVILFVLGIGIMHKMGW